MIKRTLYFGNPAYLSTHLDQVVIKLPDTDEKKTIPIEDTGMVILDHQQITISQAIIAKLLENNIAIITCDSTHHPTGLMLNLDGHTLQSQKFQAQIEAGKPLLKQLWQQTIVAKIENQANLLASNVKDTFRNLFTTKFENIDIIFTLFKSNVKDTFRNLFTTTYILLIVNDRSFKSNVKDTFRNLFTTISQHSQK